MGRGYRFSEIAKAVGGEFHLTDVDEHITHLSIDTRKPLPDEGTLFIALSGKHHDGHRYVKAALEQGVRNVLLSDASIAKDIAANTIRADDTLIAMQRLCAWHRSHFSYPVIGITGSNGKTIVKEWLYQLLSGTEHIVRSPGSWNSQVGVPLSVWEMGAEHTLGIFEAGISEPGEMEKLAPIIAPTVGVFTNVGPAHSEHFSSDKQKAEEKAKLFAKSKVIVYCRDHNVVHEALRGSNAVLRDWSRVQDAFVRVQREEVEGMRMRIVARVAGEEHAFLIPFNDAASLENALHCITTLLHLGHAPTWINERLAHLSPVAMRLRTMAGAHDTTVIDDSYSNDLASLGLALDHLARISGDRERVVVTSDILESNEKPDMLYRRMADMLKQAHVGRVLAVGPAIAARKHLFGDDAHFFASVDELLARVHTEELSGAAILVKGARKFCLERVVERWQERTHGTVLEIDLDALRHNLNHYRALLKRPPLLGRGAGGEVGIMAMVKAFGYGSGAVELARLFEHEHVHYLGVAYADEGVELRQNGVRTPILVMNPEPVPLDVMHRFQLETEVYDLRSLRASIDFAKHVPGAPPVHIKLDTGMHRLGFTAEEVPAMLDLLRDVGSLRVASVFSHLAASEDPQQDAFTRAQIQTFSDVSKRIGDVLGYAPLLHIANSAGATRFPEARFDMVRIGIGLHGIGADAQETAKLMPVATLRTVIAQVKTIPAGDTIGYGRSFSATREMRIAILPIGYADGLLRRLGNGVGKVWIAGPGSKAGMPALFVGSICMDMCVVDVTGITCDVGDDVIIFGGAHPVQELAHDLGTIPYEALTSISQRVKRVYTHG